MSALDFKVRANPSFISGAWCIPKVHLWCNTCRSLELNWIIYCLFSACVVAARGSVRGCSGGGMRGCSQGACMVAPGGCVWLPPGGCAWFFLGGMRGFSRGACVGYDEIWSMSGRYASYWNAFLFQKWFYSNLMLDTVCTVPGLRPHCPARNPPVTNVRRKRHKPERTSSVDTPWATRHHSTPPCVVCSLQRDLFNWEMIEASDRQFFWQKPFFYFNLISA